MDPSIFITCHRKSFPLTHSSCSICRELISLINWIGTVYFIPICGDSPHNIYYICIELYVYEGQINSAPRSSIITHVIVKRLRMNFLSLCISCYVHIELRMYLICIRKGRPVKMCYNYSNLVRIFLSSYKFIKILTGFRNYPLFRITFGFAFEEDLEIEKV